MHFKFLVKILAVAGLAYGMALDQSANAPANASTDTLAAANAAANAPANDVYASCRHDMWSFYTPTGYLFALCRNKNGDYMKSVLDVNRCFASADGKLVRRDNGEFIRSCRRCKRESLSLWLNCQCKNKLGYYIDTRLDMNDYLSNYDGLFCCRDHVLFCSNPFRM